MKKTISLLLILVICKAFAQEGPLSTCSNCDGAMNTPLPVNGSWYNPDQSGTGYLLEVQNGRLLGFYFGFDDNGDQQWLIFQGDLVPGDGSSDVLWKMESTFTSFSNGNTFNQAHQIPTNEPSGDSVTIEFLSKQYARISVNGGDAQNYIPLSYGIELSTPFEETVHFFPNLDGLWTFVYKIYSPETVTQQHLYYSDVFEIRDAPIFTENGTKFKRYYITKYYLAEILGLGYIECSNPVIQGSQERHVVCEMIGFPSWFLGSDYSSEKMIVPLPDLGVSEFSAEFIKPDDEFNGFTIKAIRINHLDFE